MSHAKTKVLFVSPLPPPPGGIATLTSTLIQNGIGSDYALDCVDTNVIGRPLHGEMVPDVSEIFRNLRILSSLLWKIVFFRPHIVHINSSLSRIGILRDAISAMVARIAGKKVVTHYHGSVPEFVEKGGLPLKLLNLLTRLSHINVACNSSSREYLVRSCGGRRPALYLPNFIDESRFDTTKEPPKRERGNAKLRVLYVGGLTKAKGVLDAVKVAELSNKIELTLFAPSMTEEFRALTGTLPGNVLIQIGLGAEELVRAYRDHDLFLFLSYQEGFPLSVTEAMAMSLPVLATRVGAVADMIKEAKGGWLVNPGDVSAAVAIIQSIPDRRSLASMGLYNRTVVHENYRFSVVVSQIRAMYDTLRESPPSIKN